MPASTAAPMSLVWTWQFQMPSPPTTTIESPIAAHASRNAGIVVVGRVEEVHHLVAQARHVVFAREVRGDRRGRVHDLGLGDRPAVDDLEERVEQQREALAARVDDAGVAQHGQEIGGARDRVARAPRAPCSSSATSVGDVERLERLRDRAHDGEDRALDRAHHRLVRGVGPRGGSPCTSSVAPTAIEVAALVDEAAQDLREDHAGVAAGAHERAAADRRGTPRPSTPPSASAALTDSSVSAMLVPVSPSGTG